MKPIGIHAHFSGAVFRSTANTTATSGQVDVVKPPGIVIGDVVLVWVPSLQADAWLATGGGGGFWTKYQNAAAFGYQPCLFSKVITSLDIAWPWQSNYGDLNGVGAMSVAYANPATGWTSKTFNTNSTNGLPTLVCTGFAPAAGHKGLVTFMWDRDPDTLCTPPAGTIQRATNTVGVLHSVCADMLSGYAGQAMTWTNTAGANNWGEAGVMGELI